MEKEDLYIKIRQISQRLYFCFSEIKQNKVYFNNKFARLYSIQTENCSIQQINTKKRIPKKKVALLFGFNGSGYQGLQFNPNIRSIEQELFNAIYKAGLVSTSNAIDPKRLNGEEQQELIKELVL
ncbi:unnamed protein product [Cunninghamella blakesleeana]